MCQHVQQNFNGQNHSGQFLGKVHASRCLSWVVSDSSPIIVVITIEIIVMVTVATIDLIIITNDGENTEDDEVNDDGEDSEDVKDGEDDEDGEEGEDGEGGSLGESRCRSWEVAWADAWPGKRCNFKLVARGACNV